ncbi:hypothetical protein HOF78_03335 [Candidatus Woesearchaeota archaeon]|jgi:hypothetical protein|nr:hypothetical protein [Candidatus Woesearchaeota archaeon]MBT6045106.1 hypothetical protein [Candidatus Woesearchaeota archaeon]
MKITRVNDMRATPDLVRELAVERKEFFEGVRDAYQKSGSFSAIGGPQCRDDLMLSLDGTLEETSLRAKSFRLPLRAFDIRVNNRTDYGSTRSFEEMFRAFSLSHLFGSKFRGVGTLQFGKALDNGNGYGLIGRLKNSEDGKFCSWRVHEVTSGYDPNFDMELNVDPEDFGMGSVSGWNRAYQNFESGPATFEALNSRGSSQFLGSIFQGVSIDPASFVRVEERDLSNGNEWYRLSIELAHSTLLPERDNDRGRVVQEIKCRYMDIEIGPMRQPLVLFDGDSRPVCLGIPN